MAISLSGFFKRLRVLLCFNIGTETGSKPDNFSKKGPLFAFGLRVDHTKRLPGPILANIFRQHVSLSVHSSSPFIQPHPTSAPLVVSQVNSLWRRIALATPELWSSVYIRNNTHPEILELWIARSGTAIDLNLRIDAVHTDEDLAGENYLAQFYSLSRNLLKYRTTRVGIAWSIVREQFHRWRQIELTLDVQSAFYFFDLPLIKARRLEKFSIQIVVNTVYELPPQILDSLHAYMQSSVELKWDCIPSISAIRHQVWRGLRKIHLSMGLTMDQSVMFLRECVQAEEVALGCITNNFLEFPEDKLQSEDARSLIPRRHSRLPNLQSLSIGLDGSACDCMLIVQFFTLPALRRLEMQNFGTSMTNCTVLIEFLLRSASEKDEKGWRFRELSIVDHYMPESILLMFLCAPDLGTRCVPAVSYYTRRSVRLEFLVQMLEMVGDLKKLEYYQDARGGTWIGRNGLPDTYLLF